MNRGLHSRFRTKLLGVGLQYGHGCGNFGAMSACEDKYLIRFVFGKLPEGVWMLTSPDLPGLVVEAPTRDEVVAEAPIVAQKLIESYCEHGDPLPPELLARAASKVSEETADDFPPVQETVQIAVGL